MKVARVAVVAAMLALALAPHLPVRAGVLDNTVGKPMWVKTYGNLRVQRYGSNGPALILVPGLTAGTWTWYDTIARQAKSHAIYAVTVAGMSDVPPAPSPSLDAVDASLLALIQGEKIARPVLIGHSMGGYAALRFATEHPELVRGVVAVDGLPILPGMAQLTVQQRNVAAAQAGANILAQSHDTFLKAEHSIVLDYVTDPALGERLFALCAMSDQKAVGEYFKELLAADLRPELPKLTVPTLVVAANPGVPLPSYIPPQAASMSSDDRRAAVVELYTGLMAGAPNIKVVPIDNARHFVMLDQPDAFAQALDAFLTTLPA